MARKSKKRVTKPVTPKEKKAIIKAFHGGMSWSDMSTKFGRHQSTIAYQLRGETRGKNKALVKSETATVKTAPPVVHDALAVFAAALAGTPVTKVFVDLEKREATIESKKVETVVVA